MSHDQIHHYANNTLLAMGGGSWGAYAFFKGVSEICSMVLPITGVISFFIYVVINWKKFVKAFKNDR